MLIVFDFCTGYASMFRFTMRMLVFATDQRLPFCYVPFQRHEMFVTILLCTLQAEVS